MCFALGLYTQHDLSLRPLFTQKSSCLWFCCQELISLLGSAVSLLVALAKGTFIECALCWHLVLGTEDLQHTKG